MRFIEEKTLDRLCDSYIFDSVDEMIEVSKTGRHTGSMSRERFIGRAFTDYDDVLAACRRAWPEGISTLEKMLDDLRDAAMPTPKSRKRKARFSSDDGDELDLDRLRAGQDYWRTTRREMQTGPASLTIVVDVGANCNVPADQILWRGAAAIALTQILEASGYRVELWLAQKSEGLYTGRWANDGLTACQLKRTDDPLDSSTLINAVSGWFFRTVIFMCNTLGTKPYDSCLGHSRLPDSQDLDKMTTDERRILIGGVFSHDAAVALIRKVLAGLPQH